MLVCGKGEEVRESVDLNLMLKWIQMLRWLVFDVRMYIGIVSRACMRDI